LEKITCYIKENSWLARKAARKLGSSQVAMVVGSTIYLYGTTRREFLASHGWVRHEVCHVKQFRQYGLLVFLWKYIREYRRVGYYNNRFEVAAREAELNPDILLDVEIV